MHEKSTVMKIIETFTETTQIPVMYVDDLASIPTLQSNNYDFTAVLEYADFEEIINFLRASFSETSESHKSFTTFHTKSYFIYNIVLTDRENNRGAYVSGPILPYFSDERFIDEIIMNKPLPLYKKGKFETMIRTIPFVSEERINHLGQLLYVLSDSTETCWYSQGYGEYGNGKLNLLNLSFEPENYSLNVKEKEEYNSLYSFSLELKDKIIQGNPDGIIALMNNNANLFWNLKTFDDNFRSLKNKCLVICAVAGVFAVKGNASYKRVFGLIENFSINLNNIKSEQEIVLKTAHIVETMAYLVSISSGNNFSLHIKRVMQYLKSHYKEKITLKKLAEYVGLNSVYLSSLIKKETNLSLLDNINLLRLEESKNLLIFTNKSIQEISYNLGYSYQNHFNNVFKKFTGMTPLEFRQNYGRDSLGND
ncbi:MAG: AraC family transcriptional regulator [Eubacterium sp.]|jgi:AraC-like DNA-binding protein|nr:AraC family transcriptional regulator [Eubacterium sp.]